MITPQIDDNDTGVRYQGRSLRMKVESDRTLSNRFNTSLKNRLIRTLNNINEAEQIDEETALKAVEDMYRETDWMLYPTYFSGLWQEGRSRGMTKEIYMQTDLAEDIQNFS